MIDRLAAHLGADVGMTDLWVIAILAGYLVVSLAIAHLENQEAD